VSRQQQRSERAGLQLRERAGPGGSASTQNHALAALLFVYEDVLESDLELEGLVRARTRRRLPVVLTPEEDRRMLLPNRLGDQLKQHLRKVRDIHQADLAAGYGRVELPHALARKYPNAPVEWGWQSGLTESLFIPSPPG
jgi:hypothetical protein